MENEFQTARLNFIARKQEEEKRSKALSGPRSPSDGRTNDSFYVQSWGHDDDEVFAAEKKVAAAAAELCLSGIDRQRLNCALSHDLRSKEEIIIKKEGPCSESDLPLKRMEFCVPFFSRRRALKRRTTNCRFLLVKLSMEVRMLRQGRNSPFSFTVP